MGFGDDWNAGGPLDVQGGGPGTGGNGNGPPPPPPQFPNFQGVQPIASTAYPASPGASQVAGTNVYSRPITPNYAVPQPDLRLPWYLRGVANLGGLPTSYEDLKARADMGRGAAQATKELGTGAYQWIRRIDADPAEHDTWVNQKRADFAADKKAPDTGSNPNYVAGYIGAKYGPGVVAGGLGGPFGMAYAGAGQPFINNLWTQDDLQKHGWPTALIGGGEALGLGVLGYGGRATTQLLESIPGFKTVAGVAKATGSNLLGDIAEIPKRIGQVAPWLTGLLGAGTESAIGGPGGQ